MPVITRRQQQQSEQRERTLGSSSEPEVRNVAAYPTPLSAILDGQPVKIIATGDAEGHSRVCQYVDGEGRMNWDEEALFSVYGDQRFLPDGKENLRLIAQKLTQVSRS